MKMSAIDRPRKLIPGRLFRGRLLLRHREPQR
jgi:hypothetical protein